MLAQLQEKVLAAYAGGATQEVIRQEFHVGRDALLSALMRAGVVRRTRAAASRRYLLDESVFDVITPESAYWIGFLMADGCVTGGTGGHGYKLAVGLAEKDVRHLESLRSFLKSNHPLHEVVQQRAGRQHAATYLIVCSDRLCRALISHGVAERKTFTARASSNLTFNRDFWRGLVDGDGSLGWDKTVRPVLSITNASRVLVDQFTLYLRSNGVQVADPTADRSTWRAKVSCGKAVRAARLLYSDCTVALARKRVLAHAFMESRWAD